MSTQCNHFVQNAWKKELCSNCFKSREEHSEVNDNTAKFNPARVTAKVASKLRNEAKPQSILKGKTSSKGKKKVAFPDALSEVIGYGGDDSSDSEEFELSDSLGIQDDLPDGEEERALCNLTRANTNFNTVTANLSSNSAPDSKKSFSLMLGKPRKDSEGKKKTLLVSVTPFGGDTNVIPSAKRPSEWRTKTFSNFTNFNRSGGEDVAQVTLKSVSTIAEDRIVSDSSEKETHEEMVTAPLGKIVDMPLITSSNLISVIQKSDSLNVDPTSSRVVTESYQKSADPENGSVAKKIGITRASAVKKQRDVADKPKITSIDIMQENYKQTLNSKDNYIASWTSDNLAGIMYKESESYHGIDNEVSTDSGNIQMRNFENREGIWSATIRGKTGNVMEVKLQGMDEEGERNRKRGTPEKDDDQDAFSYQVSRELAGEPDGRADEEMVEPPALPRSPPPHFDGGTNSRISEFVARQKNTSSEPRNSFLHNTEKKTKPAVPQKPICLPAKQSLQGFRGNSESPRSDAGSNLISAACASGVRNVQGREQEQVVVKIGSSSVTEEGNVAGGEDEEEEAEDPDETMRQISGDSEAELLVRSPNKRRMAPKPPPPSYVTSIATATATTSADDGSGGLSLFARKPGATNLKSDSPVVREKEKRERASSCSPKFRKDGELELRKTPVETTKSNSDSNAVPEPTPRRMISLSQDSLASTDRAEEKKKARSRFSLKKFLRMGAKKDQVEGPLGISARAEIMPNSPQPGPSKPRLEIIHPLELDGAAVEVVSRDRVAKITEEVKTNVDSGTTDIAETYPSSLSTSPGHHTSARPGKPPPPPRNQSLDDWARLDPANKPVRPPPPRSELKSPAKSWHPPSPTATDSIYANLAAEDVPGEVRSALAPSKPQRTASMRDQAVCQPLAKRRFPAAATTTCQPEHEQSQGGLDYPADDASRNMPNDCSHAYECLSSSPECDSTSDLRNGAANREGIHNTNSKRKSDSSALDPSSDLKYHQQPFTRSTSLPYCGSETESEVYSPYSFYTGDEGPEEDQDWKNNKEHESRVGRLSKRRGRSIVHRSLEDNYGAVVVANHEALAQVLEQLNQSSGIPPVLRVLKTATPRLTDFTLDESTCLPLGRRIFYTATWKDTFVTIYIALDPALHVSRKEFNLVPIIAFTDMIPDFVAEKMNCGKGRNVEATVSVLPHLRVSTISSFASTLKDSTDENYAREACFVLLQLVNALKSLQARGVEEAPKHLDNAILCREENDACYRLYLLRSLGLDVKGECAEEERASLCTCVLQALRDLALCRKLPLVKELLERDRMASLSQVKSVLEYSLWGPADVTLGGPRDREMTLQRWLDLERATVLHALVRARAPLAVTEEYHLLFLVRTSAKIMCEASILLDAQRRQ